MSSATIRPRNFVCYICTTVTDSMTKTGHLWTYNVSAIENDFTLFCFIVSVLHNSLTNKAEAFSMIEVSLWKTTLGTLALSATSILFDRQNWRRPPTCTCFGHGCRSFRDQVLRRSHYGWMAFACCSDSWLLFLNMLGHLNSSLIIFLVLSSLDHQYAAKQVWWSWLHSVL